MRRRLNGLVALAALVVLPPAARAQVLGTYSWQLAPYCNVVTVNVTQAGATYTLDGYDTQCGGASNRAPVTGMAVPNPAGTIGVGLTIVTSPGGTPVHIDAAIDLATLSGTWRDSLGGTGDFVFTPAGVATGSPRPLAVAAIPDGAITAPKLADGAVTATKIDAAQVQRRVGGVCPAGQLMTGVSESGSVSCETVTSGAGGDITGVAAGTGLTGGGVTGDVSLAANFSQVQARVAAACPANETIRSINADGTVACDVDNDSGGDITAVIAGQGLAGGSLAGNATLNVILGGPGSSTASARADHTHERGAGGTSTAIGAGALSVVAGAGNTAIGQAALGAVTLGTENTATGAQSLAALVTGSRNTATGFEALSVSTAADNTAVGHSALGQATSGGGNSALGASALVGNVTGSDNVAVGKSALFSANADDNTAVGAFALSQLASGSDNVAVGLQAGSVLNTGSFNIYLGAQAGSTAEENTIRIGRSAQHSRTFLAGIRGVTTGINNAQTVVIDGAGQLGTVSSSRRTKFDIAGLDASVTSALQALRPVQFRYRRAFADGSMPIQYGLIAEEVQDVLPELVATDNDGQPASVKYHVLPTLLLADVQRLERERQALQDTVAEQRRAIDALASDLAAIRAQMVGLTATVPACTAHPPSPTAARTPSSPRPAPSAS
jgi:hypothetical protein